MQIDYMSSHQDLRLKLLFEGFEGKSFHVQVLQSKVLMLIPCLKVLTEVEGKSYLQILQSKDLIVNLLI